jgi:alginate O-acetyltransferase complex protein AlgI
MLFNSLHFVFFFPVVVALYFAVPHRYRWALLLAGSYYFYGSWRPEYLLLLMASTGVDYAAALGMERARTLAARRRWMALSLTSNLGMLGYFKYAGFLASSVQAIVSPLGIVLGDAPAFNPLLPIGISFYTFQTLGYAIDVYRGTVPAERHLGRFALYVCFFPQLIAGPIERAGRLLPQFLEVQRFHGGRVVSGLTLMGWGFFQKLVIADRLAPFVNEVFAGSGAETAGTVLLASYFFYFQLYADFSGYTHIALGAARVLGFRLMENFDRAYLATSMSEVFRRWHISLMSWFRDYVARPLGFSRIGTVRWGRTVLVVFLLSGLWHGAGWNFIGWGVSTAILVMVGDATRRRRDRLWKRAQAAADRLGAGMGRGIAAGRRLLAWWIVFNLMCLTLIFFRAPTFTRALEMYGALATRPGTLFSLDGLPLPGYQLALALGTLALFLIVDGVGRSLRWPERFAVQPRVVRWSVAYALLLAVLAFGEFDLVPFIYFQF